MVEGVFSEGTEASEGDFSLLGCCATGAATDAGAEAGGAADDAGELEVVEGAAGWEEGAGATALLGAGPESSSRTPAWRGSAIAARRSERRYEDITLKVLLIAEFHFGVGCCHCGGADNRCGLGRFALGLFVLGPRRRLGYSVSLDGAGSLFHGSIAIRHRAAGDNLSIRGGTIDRGYCTRLLMGGTSG